MIRTRGLCVRAVVLSQLSYEDPYTGGRPIEFINPLFPSCDGHIFISLVFPQFTSFHSVFHSFSGLINSIIWPASSVWVFIAQLGEHCSAKAEATGSNPVEAPDKLFFGLFRNCLKLRFTAMVIYSFQNDLYVTRY